MAAAAKREALNAQCEMERAEQLSSRQLVHDLESQIAETSRQRDILQQKLNEADRNVADAARLKDLEAAVAAKGGDVASLLAELRSEATASVSSQRPVVGRKLSRDVDGDLLKEKTLELQRVQEQQKSLQSIMDQDDEDSDALQKALDDARYQLQNSLRELANKNALEVSKLEAELQAERQRVALEAVTEQHCEERISDLKSAVVDAQSRSEMAVENRRQQDLTEASRCSALTSELATVRTEMSAAENRLTASTRRAAEAEVRRAKAEADASRRIAKLRGMIEQIWTQLRDQAALVDVQVAAVPPLISAGVRQV